MILPFEPFLSRSLKDDEPLWKHSTFKIGGNAHYFAEPRSQEQLLATLEFADTWDIPYLIIGNASNILFADREFEGMIISLRNFEMNRINVDANYVTVSAGMGLVRFAHVLAEHSLGGMEFVSTIPGTVGGGLVMNAGFSRVRGRLNQMADWLVSVKALGRDGITRIIKREDIAFQYRSSDLAGNILVEATFKLDPTPKEEVKMELRANAEYRESVQDLKYPSAGSVFKNPKNTEFTAGKLIDMVGLRGFKAGDAQISQKHGNFIINLGKARAQDVLELIATARGKVRDSFGVDLEMEVQYISSESLPLTI